MRTVYHQYDDTDVAGLLSKYGHAPGIAAEFARVLGYLSQWGTKGTSYTYCTIGIDVREGEIIACYSDKSREYIDGDGRRPRQNFTICAVWDEGDRKFATHS